MGKSKSRAASGRLTGLITTGRRYNAVVTRIANEGYAFALDGLEIRSAVLSPEVIDAIKAEVSVDHEILRRTGIRNLEKKFRSIARVAAEPSVLSIGTSLLGRPPRLVRALFFGKTPERNWFVAWHQDRTVTVNRRVEIAGWGPWTWKDGVHHVQPPRAVLDHMVAIRLHLDDADEEGGCLNVIPGSHRLGILAQNEIDRAVATSRPRACVVAAGDAVIIHPLVLHSSRKSQRSTHRRVVHLEYSSYGLPTGVSWA
jgi:ectoine hydroxylase-related dioxygenase (phytanoyl-CoA dioxygenase family)